MTDVTKHETQRQTADRMSTTSRVQLWATVVLIVVVIGFAIQTHQRQEQIDETHDQVELTAEQVEQLKAYVDDLQARAADPSEQERNSAITRAVQIVPEIRGILCEAFPGATACAQD